MKASAKAVTLISAAFLRSHPFSDSLRRGVGVVAERVLAASVADTAAVESDVGSRSTVGVGAGRMTFSRYSRFSSADFVA
jgi:hypothetical protein